MDNGIEFFTATCLNWQPPLEERKDTVRGSNILDKEDWGFITHYAGHL
jgi:hypothetical protein